MSGKTTPTQGQSTPGDLTQGRSMAAEQRQRRSIWSLVGLALAMFGFAFALVPLYDVFCDITGINGKTASTPTTASARVDTSRQITVEFVSYINPGMPWTFEPEVRRMVVHPGQTQTVNYAAHNLAQEASIGQAVPSVSPGQGAQYLNKIECFCFNRQPLAAGESARLPLVFYIDPALPAEIHTLTLAYTLFQAPSSETAQTQ